MLPSRALDTAPQSLARKDPATQVRAAHIILYARQGRPSWLSSTGTFAKSAGSRLCRAEYGSVSVHKGVGHTIGTGTLKTSMTIWMEIFPEFSISGFEPTEAATDLPWTIY